VRWKGRRGSENIEDQRTRSSGGFAIGSGIGTILLVLLLSFLGGDPSQVIGQLGAAGQRQGEYVPTREEEDLKEFVSVTLADTEDVWNQLFRLQGRRYDAPKLVLFSGNVQSACGFASAAVGPFYCPDDQKVYIDLSFFKELRDRFGAGGDFAQAYVIAHEVGHHVQNLLGISESVERARRTLSEKEANQVLVRLELQADFLAGVWAHHVRDQASLDKRDIREAIEAANAIGDDTLQKRAQGYLVPDSFTHGTSEQRVRWFLKGFRSGRISDGDTFNATRL
jgi:predicted metalloprotease